MIQVAALALETEHEVDGAIVTGGEQGFHRSFLARRLHAARAPFWVVLVPSPRKALRRSVTRHFQTMPSPGPITNA